MSQIAQQKSYCSLPSVCAVYLKYRVSLLLAGIVSSQRANSAYLLVTQELGLAGHDIIGVPGVCGRKDNKRRPGKLKGWNHCGGGCGAQN